MRNKRSAACGGLIAVAATSLAVVLSGTPAVRAEEGHDHAAAVAAATAKQAAFHDAMRKLWEDHVTWTRLAIVSFAHDLPDLPATQDRLLRNQADIGNAIKPYYGRAAGNQLTALLDGAHHRRGRPAAGRQGRRPEPGRATHRRSGTPTAARSPTSSTGEPAQLVTRGRCAG